MLLIIFLFLGFMKGFGFFCEEVDEFEMFFGWNGK